MNNFATRFYYDYEIKVELTKRRIEEIVKKKESEGLTCYVSFSGGLDSTVLLHLVRTIYPEMQGIFFDTKIEMPEIYEFVKGTENVRVIGKEYIYKTYPQIVKEDGYPIVSKNVSSYIKDIRFGSEKMKKLRLGQSYGTMFKLSKKWYFLLDSDLKINSKCCSHLKKYPANRLRKKENMYALVGMRSDESLQRSKSIVKYGCELKDFARPLAYWNDDDIKRYVEENNVEYCNIYDMPGITSTGCFVCMLGVRNDKEFTLRLDRIRHRKKYYDYFMAVNKEAIEVLGFKDLGKRP